MEPMKQPEGYERLTCLCGQGRFAKMTHLRWKAGSGITEEPAGFFCLECHGVVDAATMIQQAQHRAKKRELKDLEDEIQQTQPRVARKEAAHAGGTGKVQS